MLAGIQWIPPGARGGFLRVGPEFREYGDPYDFFVGFITHDGVNAEIVGLITDEGSPLQTGVDLARPHIRAATQALAAEGLKANWKRARHMPLPNKDDARNSDGTVKLEVLKEHLPKVIAHFEETGSTVSSMGEFTTAEVAPPIPEGAVRHYFDVIHKG